MAAFKDIIGQEQLKEHLQTAIRMNKVSHAYIINGERSSGKEFIAQVFAMALQCEKGGEEPCQECHSCKQALSHNQPDIIRITHEKPNTVGVEDIRAICERVCGGRLSAPEFILENGETAMTLSSLPLFEAEYAGRQITKENEDYCGDSVSFAESDEGYSYCFICDGMGSGREAALTARICRIFLEKMLACGNKKSTTLEMLNMIIAGKGVECFATVDLLEIDLMLGTASFIKSGATPSYVIRG